MRIDMQNKDRELADLRARIPRMDADIRNLQGEIKASNQTVGEMHDKIRILTMNLSQREEDIRRLSQANTGLANIQHLQQLLKSREEEIGSLQRARQEMEQRAVNAENESRGLRASNESLKNQAATLVAQSQAQQQQIVLMQQQLSQLQQMQGSSSSTFQSDITILRQRIKELEGEREDLIRKQSTLPTRERWEEMGKEREGLEGEVERYRQRERRVEGELNRLRGEIEIIIADRDRYRLRAETLDKEIDEMRAKRADLDRESEQLKDRIRVIEGGKGENGESMRAEIKSLSEKLNHSKDETAKLREELYAAKEKVLETGILQERLSNAKGEISSLRDRLNQMAGSEPPLRGVNPAPPVDRDDPMASGQRLIFQTQLLELKQENSALGSKNLILKQENDNLNRISKERLVELESLKVDVRAHPGRDGHEE